MDKIVISIGIVVSVLCLVLFAIWLLCKVASSDGRVEYCYVESMYYGGRVFYDVRGKRNWRKDHYIAHTLDSMEQAKQVAQTYGCELK